MTKYPSQHEESYAKNSPSHFGSLSGLFASMVLSQQYCPFKYALGAFEGQSAVDHADIKIVYGITPEYKVNLYLHALRFRSMKNSL